MKKNLIQYCFLFLAVFSFYIAKADERINNIVISGNQRIEEGTIKNYLGIKPGDEFTSENRTKAIKNLYATSMFENIEIKFNDGVMKISVQETPMVSAITFKGNSKIKADVFSKELFTEVGESLSNAKLQSDIDKIAEIYKRSGRFSVTVLPEIEKLPNNRAKVIFKITEGPKTAIRHIYFVGNENYRSNDLRSVIMTKETAWYKFMDSNDTYDPDRMEYDKELLTKFYQSVGFADINVISATAELSPTKNYFVATYSIEEGNKYKLGEIKIQNNITDVDTTLIKKYINVKSGDVFNMTALEKIGDTISDELGNFGYPQMSINPILDKNPEQKIINVTFVVNKADKVFINKINITGNAKTSERVIRREFKIAEDDVFDRNQIMKAERNIRNLDYFEKVDIKSIRSEKNPDRYDINMDVQEKSTASIGLDLGYSTAEGPFGAINFAEKNLFGTGKHLDAGVRRSQRRLSYSLGLTDPHFLDKDLSLGGSIFKSSSGSKASSGFDGEAQPYAQNTIGSKIALGYDISEDLSHEIEYLIKEDKLKVKQGPKTSILVSEQAGKFVTSAIGHTFTYDKLDSRVVPKNGYILSLTQQYAGVGGNNKYLKHESDAKIFKSFFNNKITLKIFGEVGVINGCNGKTVRISDRFSLGDYNLRGFAGGGVGPRDKKTKEGLNGQKYYSGGVELTFPIGLPEEMNVSGAVFSDIGGLWDFEIPKGGTYSKKDVYNSKMPRISVGAGIIWVTRIMPIRVDWAIPLRYKHYDEQQRFHIRMSTSF